MALFVGGAQGALVRLRCPSCGEVQARARKPGGGTVKYRCRRCYKLFTREAGEALDRRVRGTSRR
jgi:transposase-like protein